MTFAQVKHSLDDWTGVRRVDAVEGDVSEWISVKERLPVGCDHLLLLDIGSPEDNPQMVIGYWNRITKCWMCRGIREYELPVTHWMLLPDPPENSRAMLIKAEK